MTDIEAQILDKLDRITSESTSRAEAMDPFGNARKVRAHVVSMLIQTHGSDPDKVIRTAKKICDFNESGVAIDAIR